MREDTGGCRRCETGSSAVRGVPKWVGCRLTGSWGSAYPGLAPGKTDGHPEVASAAWTPHFLVLPQRDGRRSCEAETSSQRSNASSSTDARSRPRPKRAWPFSNTWEAGTTVLHCAHLSMLLMRRDFAGWRPVPRGVCGGRARPLRWLDPGLLPDRCGGTATARRSMDAGRRSAPARPHTTRLRAHAPSPRAPAANGAVHDVDRLVGRGRLDEPALGRAGKGHREGLRYGQRSPRLNVIASNGRIETASSSFAHAMSTHSPSRSSNASRVRSVGSTSHRCATPSRA